MLPDREAVTDACKMRDSADGKALKPDERSPNVEEITFLDRSRPR